MPDTHCDIFTLGETMIRLTPPGFVRLEEASELELRIGGAESNLAIAAARLGLRAAWASKLPRNPLGELTARRIRGFGVDVSQVRWVDEGRMGLYFIEPGAPPRSSSVLYDRAGSAASTMSPEEFDWSFLSGSRHLHLTGITAALGEAARSTAERAIREAGQRGCSVSFDVNHRVRLWPHEAARLALLPLIRDVDILISTQADAEQVFGLSGDPEEVMRALGDRTGAPLLALTLGARGALLWDRSRFYRADSYPVQVVDRIGAGDAFDAGLLYGCLEGDPERGLLLGTAMAAIKHTLPGDEFISSLAEVEGLIRSGHRDIQR